MHGDEQIRKQEEYQDKDIIGFIKCWMNKLKELENKIDDPVWVLANDDYCKECQEYIELANRETRTIQR